MKSDDKGPFVVLTWAAVVVWVIVSTVLYVGVRGAYRDSAAADVRRRALGPFQRRGLRLRSCYPGVVVSGPRTRH